MAISIPSIKDVCRTNSPQPLLDAMRVLFPYFEELTTTVNSLAEEVITDVTIVRNGTDDAIIQLTKESGETLQSPAYGIEMWESLELENLPTDFSEGQELMVTFLQTITENNPASWTTAISTNPSASAQTVKPVIRFMLSTASVQGALMQSINVGQNAITGLEFIVEDVSYWNNTTNTTTIAQLIPFGFNSASTQQGTGISLSRSNITTYIESIKRKL